MKGPIVVVGGGTAGWLGALFFKKLYPNEDVTIIESSKIGIIGVGEGSTPYLQELLKFLNIDILTIFKKADITFKNGAYFVGWDDLNVEFNNAFNIFNNEFYHASKTLLNYFLLNKSKDVFDCVNPLHEITLKKQIAPIVNNLPANDFSIHFNTFKMRDTLKDIGLQRGIKIIDSIVNDVIVENNMIKTLILENNIKISGNFYIDCTGFKRLLPNKLGIKFTEFHELLNDSAVTCDIPTTIYNPYTECMAMDYGWRWLIPTASRAGSGYVFSSKYISDEDAIKEYVNSVKLTSGITIEPSKVIKFKSGMLDNLYFSNVLCLGLCSHFIEPLEATSIAITAQTLFEFKKKHSKEVFNLNMKKNILQIKDFIVLHYLTRKNNTKYWVDAKKVASNNEFISLLLHDLSINKVISYDTFKDNNNYFSFVNHLLFLQKYGYITKKIQLKEYSNNDMSINYLKKFQTWYREIKEKAVDYKTFYIQLQNDT